MFPKRLFEDKDRLDEFLHKIFSLIIDWGTVKYSNEKNHNNGLDASNFLKQDKNYYGILKDYWNIALKEKVISIFQETEQQLD